MRLRQTKGAQEEQAIRIYLGATSAYGLHIVRQQAGGGFERLRKGAEGAEWMAGQFGPNEAGPGAIWKIDGQTGEVSRFAKLPENSGPGVGTMQNAVFYNKLRAPGTLSH